MPAAAGTKRVMMKLKIVHKGLILVAVPLIFGIGFITMLCYGLNQSDRIVQRELMLKDAKISYINATRSTAAAKICGLAYTAGHEPYYKEHYQENKEQAISSYKHLKHLLKNEKKLEIPDLMVGSRQIFRGRSPSSESPFLRDLQKMCDRQTREALNSTKYLEQVLIGGVIVGILLALGLARFFCLNITNRLLIIINNTVSLSKGTALSAPLAGTDEIAELDQFLYKSATQIRELERFKKEMIGVVSHELKSPLSSVGGFLSSLGTGVFGEISQKAKDKVTRTHNSVKRLMTLVADLLYLDRLELETRPEEIAVDELLAASVDTVKELSEQSGIEIIVKNEATKVYADRNRLLQVIVNLLSNAMKFSPEKGKVTIEAKQQEGWFECRVSDQGRGIPELFRKQIFEPFKQVDATDETTKKGTGLGLTISHSIVQQHGGTIGVDSEEGKGSTFWFKVPATETVFTQSKLAAQKSAENEIAPIAGDALITKNEKGKKVKGASRFSVLQQGMIIISVPLIFQLSFAAVIGYMLNEIREQTKREENSKEVVDTLNRMTETITGAANNGMMYCYTKAPPFLKLWETGKHNALALLDHAIELSGNNVEQVEDIKATRAEIDALSKVVETEAKNGENRAGFSKLLEMGGMGGMVEAVSKMAAANGESMGDWMQAMRQGGGGMGGAMGRGGMRAIIEKMGGMERVEEMMRAMPSPDKSGMDMGGNMRSMMGIVSQMSNDRGIGGMGALGMMNQFQSLFQNSVHVKMVKPFVEGGAAQERLMSRENAVGEKLAKQRSDMIKTLNLTLLGGILLNVVLSICLAIFLMRNISNRLQHVMENTARLVKREALDPPIAGGDDIAYLDQVLFETGNRLVELETFKRELIAIVSHELRTPLLSISSALELFSAGALGELSAKAMSRLRFAQDEANRLIRLINDLLDIEKMEAGKFMLDIAVVELADPVKKSLASIAHLAEAKEIKLDVNYFDPSARLSADQDRICQVLINLLSNAIKFSPEGGTIAVSVESIPSESAVHELLKFSVKDQGRGIPDELRAKIFDRFVQVEKSDETLRGGSGLGLAISKAIIEQHGGKIGVDSVIGQGSTFWFTLPYAQHPVKLTA